MYRFFKAISLCRGSPGLSQIDQRSIMHLSLLVADVGFRIQQDGHRLT